MKKKIAWVTADYFLDCDIDLIAELVDEYHIDWNIVLPMKNSRFSKEQLEEMDTLKKINKVFWLERYRLRDIKNIVFYWRILRHLKRRNPDVIYINIQGFPYLAFLCFFLLDRKNTIFAVHQAQVHEGMKFKKITTLYFRFLYSWFSYFHLFSKTQTEIFKRKYKKKKESLQFH